MSNGIFSGPPPRNEPVLGYTPGSPERKALRAQLDRMGGRVIEITPRIGGRRIRTGRTAEAVMPHDHRHVLAVWHKAGAARGRSTRSTPRARRTASGRGCPGTTARRSSSRPRICSPARTATILNAATMLGQSKTAHQAEIDAACELIDFWRFNVRLRGADLRRAAAVVAGRLEPRSSTGRSKDSSSRSRRSTSRRSPATCRRRRRSWATPCVWKPASTAVYSAHFIMELLEEAGLPPGVINFVPGAGAEVGDPALASPALAGIHFTGSTAVFQGMWKTIGGTSRATGTTRASSARPAARTSSSRTRRPTWPRS